MKELDGAAEKGRAETPLELRTERMVGTLVQRPKRYLESRDLEAWRRICTPKRQCLSSVWFSRRLHCSWWAGEQVKKSEASFE